MNNFQSLKSYVRPPQLPRIHINIRISDVHCAHTHNRFHNLRLYIMEAVPEYNYQIEHNPEPEKIGQVDLSLTFVRPDNMEPILTRSTFSCSLLAQEFIEDENYPHKQQLHYFLTESGVGRRDAVTLILKLVILARKVTSSVVYSPRCALLLWLTLDVVPLGEESYRLEEVRRPYIDDYRTEEKIKVSVDDYVLSYIDDSQAPPDEYEESILDDYQVEDMIQASRDEYEDSQIEEVIPASLSEYKFRPASKLRVKSLSRRTYKKKRKTITIIADQCTIYKSKLETSSINDKCTICLENFDSEREVVFLPCGHEFDDKCIEEWLGIGHVCPLCRFEFPCEADEIPQTPITEVF